MSFLANETTIVKEVTFDGPVTGTPTGQLKINAVNSGAAFNGVGSGATWVFTKVLTGLTPGTYGVAKASGLVSGILQEITLFEGLIVELLESAVPSGLSRTWPLVIQSQPFTLSDAVARLAARSGMFDYGENNTIDNRKLLRATRDALRDIASHYGWRYYNRFFRVTTDASVTVYVTYTASTKNAEIDYSDGQSLDENGDPIVWPDNAQYGELLIDGKVVDVATRTDDENIALAAGQTEDFSGQVTWSRRRYPLPLVRNIKSVTEEATLRSLKAATFDFTVRQSLSMNSPGQPNSYSLEAGDREHSLTFSPAPTNALEYVLAATVAPSEARVFRDQVTITCAEDATSLVISNATEQWIGCVLRRGKQSATDKIEAIIYDEWEWEAYITGVSGTTVTISEAMERSASSELMLVSSPLDIAITAQTYFESLAYANYCRNHKHDSLEDAVALAERDLRQAQSADAISGESSKIWEIDIRAPMTNIYSARWEA